MLAPKFTLRTIFAITVVAALLCLIGVWGVQGVPWAAGVSIGLLVGFAMLTTQVIAFAVFWALGEAISAARPHASTERDEST